MLNITYYQRNANQNHNKQSEWLLSKSLQAINAGEGVEKREPSYTVGGNANQYSHYGEQCGESLKLWVFVCVCVCEDGSEMIYVKALVKRKGPY